jgi:hypothetical protein
LVQAVEVALAITKEVTVEQHHLVQLFLLQVVAVVVAVTATLVVAVVAEAEEVEILALTPTVALEVAQVAVL